MNRACILFWHWGGEKALVLHVYFAIRLFERHTIVSFSLILNDRNLSLRYVRDKIVGSLKVIQVQLL
jgi:hypothetical protein